MSADAIKEIGHIVCIVSFFALIAWLAYLSSKD